MTLNHTSVGFWLRRRAQLSGDHVAVDFHDREITYTQLQQGADEASGLLQSLGVNRGDRVAVISENRPEFIEFFFACAQIGAVVVPISWRLSEPEMRWQISDCDPKIVVASDDYVATAKGLFEGPLVQIADSKSQKPGSAAPVEFDDPLMILYTSGTTGKPKGAVLTHGNFFWANLNMILAAGITDEEVSLMFLPMFHIGGWNVNTLSMLWQGAKVVLEQTFDPSRALDLISKKKVTLIMGVPANYLFMSQQPAFETADFSSVRLVVVGGAPMPESLLKAYTEKGVKIVQGYGLTELAPNALLLPTGDASRKLGSAGKPYFFTDTRLMDEQGNLIEGPGTGEIVARGPVVMKEYWNRPDETAETIRDGWLHTGDIGRIDKDGYFYIVDRVKDMIISGGENVYPAEVENVIYEHPAVAEAAVIGIPDEKWGETVHAIVVTKPGVAVSEDELKAHCVRNLAKFKTPRTLEIRADPLPRTPAGKVLKTELRAPFWKKEKKKI